MNILVTGGAGYIGSHACKALAAAGHTPVVYDVLDRGHAWAVKWGPLERGDICDAARLEQVFAQYRPAAVMHFAALAYAGESVQQPERYRRVNVEGTRTLLEAMRFAGVTQMVFSGSCSVYGDAAVQPITESAPRQPVSPYGQTKHAGELLLEEAARDWGLRSASLRYFNASGADPDGELGEDHTPETHLLPLVLEVAAGKRPHIEVFGSDYPTPDGTCVRDYIHVCDLADAHVRALTKVTKGDAPHSSKGTLPIDCDAPQLSKGSSPVEAHSSKGSVPFEAPFEAYNLGTGKGHSVLEVIETAQRVTGRPIKLVMKPRRPGDPAVAYADASLARRELGWTPRYPALETILGHAWAWMQSR